jgi:uncharacterized protein (DUF427 family)
MSKLPKIPGPDHPITITRNPKRVVIEIDGKILADTTAALTLQEASYPPVHYIPRKDVEMARLTRTARTSYCPYKGDCAYYSIPEGGEKTANSVWSYETPYDAVAEIREYLAFYPDRVTIR